MDFATEKGALASVARGDVQAFDRLFLYYYPRIKGFISGLLQNEEEAEDISQDIFVSMWQNRERLTNIRNLNAYLFRVAKNAVFRYIERALLFRDYRQQTEQAFSVQSSRCEQEDELYARELEFLISAVVNKMPPQRKQIYKMSRIEGLCNDEIAARLSINKRTVENHLTLALATIRKVIGLFFILFC